MTLTDTQLAAVRSEAKRTLLFGTAGTGKTLVLSERIKHLLAEGVDPGEICAVTFTLKAASELAGRLGQVAKDLGHCGTLHSLSYKLIGRALIVIDEEIAREILDEVIEALRYKGTLKDVRAKLASGPYGSRADGQAGLVASEYFRLLEEHGLSDYESLLHLGLASIEGSLFYPNHLLIDEAADATALDWRIYDALDADNYFVSADPSQAIFNFRGATPEHIRALIVSGDWTLFHLDAGHRCAPAIAAVANAVLDGGHIGTAFEGTVNIRSFGDEDVERDLISHEISQLPKGNGDVAILTRTNALADRYADALRSLGVPVAQVGKVPSDWRAACDLVELMVNPTNDYFAGRVLKRLVGEEQANAIKLQALEKFMSLNSLHFKLPSESTPLEVIDVLAKAKLSDESQALIQQTLLLNPQLHTAGELAVAIAGNDLTPKTDGVQVLTVHRAKGLEFDTAYLPAFEEAIWNKGDDAENRRVAFVALTRARKELRISFAASRTMPWKKAPTAGQPSRFL